MKYFNKIKFIALVILSLNLIQCKNSTNNSENDSEYYTESDGYIDGTYCAEVEYYYSETGTRSNYTLLVDIENNELVKIHWPNGGWLDDSHFTPPNIENGSAYFTSDKRVEYNITILGQENDCDITTYAKDEDDLIQEKEDAEYQQKRDNDEEDYKKKQQDEEDEANKIKKEDERKKQLEEEEEKRKEEEEEKENED